MWLLGLCLVLIVDLLPKPLALWSRLLLAASSIGVFNEVAVLSGGQINQAFSLFAALGAIWCVRWVGSARARAIALALGGATVTAAYPEFLAAIPLYLLCAALLRPLALMDSAAMVAATGLGVAAVFSASALRILLYLFSMIHRAPGWWPLASEPRNALELWTAVVFQRTLPLWVVALVIALAVPVAFATLRRPLPTVIPSKLAKPAVGAVVVLVILWSVLVFRRPNVNYATFKLGGWIGPGLLLLCWHFAQYSGRSTRTAILSLVVVISTFRVVALGVDAAGKITDYAIPVTLPIWSREEIQGVCTVSAAADEPRALMVAIAGSSAPHRHCTIQLP